MNDNNTDGCGQCENCGESPKGVTMAPEMDGWSCPYCGHYNTTLDQVAESNGDDVSE